MSDLLMLGYLGCSFLLRDARKEAGTGRDVGTSLLGTITDVSTSLGERLSYTRTGSPAG
jgi:hypothetical protein